ncbi:MAG: insulinase family protein [Deltaproteobacteria bacterium]|nr:insulinase family protein [Deltaproteobacteria bacterium]
MRKTALVAAVLVCACTAAQRVERAPAAPAPVPDAGPPQPPPPPPPPPDPVVIVRHQDSPVVAVRLLFRAGSVDDPAGQAGATSLAADWMAEATQALDAAALAEALFPWATYITTRTDRETAVFGMSVHRDVAALAIPLLFDVVTHPRLDPADLERLRHDAVAAIEKGLRRADDEELGWAALQRFLWDGHPYAALVDGHVGSLTALTGAQLRAHAARVFTRARLVAGLGGGFDPETERIFRVAIQRIPPGEAWEPVPLPPVPPPSGGLRIHLVQKDTESTPITLGFRHALTRAHPDFVPLMVAVSALGEHRQMGGRLFQRMREERGLNYGSYAYLEHFVEEGDGPQAALNIPCRQHAFSLWVRPVAAADRAFALRQVLREWRAFVSDGLTEEEFQRTRDFLRGYTRLAEQGARRRLAWAMDDHLNGTPEFLRHARMRMETLTRDEVNAAIRRHLQAEHLVATLLAPDAEALRAALLSGAPSQRANVPAALAEEDAAIAAYDLQLGPGALTITPAAELFR